MTDEILIAGAGLSGATVARLLAEAGLNVTVYDPLPHVAGMCHTERDPETGILIHRHGPHIFHTDDTAVWNFLRRFARFRSYHHRVEAQVGNIRYPLPINLNTLRQFTGMPLTPTSARNWLASQVVPNPAPANFEEAALATIGPALYEAFFAGYTAKQWGHAPRDLPASVFARLPVRVTEDESYFHHKTQALPEDGYTTMTATMLRHPRITLRLGQALRPGAAAAHVFWTGPLDAYFDHRAGRLGYRTLDFETRPGTQRVPVVNYPDPHVSHTRVTEHRLLAPWEGHSASLQTTETPRDAGPRDALYYPLRLAADTPTLKTYQSLARAQTGVTFLGRLGSYRYIDMDRAITEAMACAEHFLTHQRQGTPMPVLWAA